MYWTSAQETGLSSTGTTDTRVRAEAGLGTRSMTILMGRIAPVPTQSAPVPLEGSAAKQSATWIAQGRPNVRKPECRRCLWAELCSAHELCFTGSNNIICAGVNPFSVTIAMYTMSSWVSPSLQRQHGWWKHNSQDCMVNYQIPQTTFSSLDIHGSTTIVAELLMISPEVLSRDN